MPTANRPAEISPVLLVRQQEFSSFLRFKVNSNQASPTIPYFDGDQPVERREDDRLGRRSFAESLARQVQAVPAKHGFTIGITGEWGSGKTSVLNMVAETLECEGPMTAVLRFNPWLFGSADELVTRFFRELSTQLGESKYDMLKDVARAFSELGKVAAPLSPVPWTVGVANLFVWLVNGSTQPRSLVAEREHLRKALGESSSRVVVLVDDIDRLEANEIRELMRLVRLTSDLPNVVFLLAFDRGHVCRSLGETESEGQRYLDKIVQVTYNLPVVRETSLPGILLPLLEQRVRDHCVTELDPEVWRSVFYEVIKPLLGNLRDVKRYLTSLTVTLDMIGGEVALADLLSMEAIRILRPELFDALKTNSELLVESSSDVELLINPDRRKGEIR